MRHDNIFCCHLQQEQETAKRLMHFEDTVLALVLVTFGSLTGYQSYVLHEHYLLQSFCSILFLLQHPLTHGCLLPIHSHM